MSRRRPLHASYLLFLAYVIGFALRSALIYCLPWTDRSKLAEEFASFYSELSASVEQSLSVPGFDHISHSQSTNSPISKINSLIADLWGMAYGRLCLGGSSGAMLLLLVAVIPRLSKRPILLIDELAHQSCIGGATFAKFQIVRIPRCYCPNTDTYKPIQANDVVSIVDIIGPEQIAAAIIVAPSYDGARNVMEEACIVKFLKSKNIISVFDAAWGANVCFKSDRFPLFPRPDVLISSPHKKNLSMPPHGVVATSSLEIAELIDEAGRMGFATTSPSYVALMVTEFRLRQLKSGACDTDYLRACESADLIRNRVTAIHPQLRAVGPEHVGVTHWDPTHLLLNTQKIGVDARDWARILSDEFFIDPEKSTHGNLLLLVGNDTTIRDVEVLLQDLKSSLEAALHLLNTDEEIDNVTPKNETKDC